jgi:hypothetical protein
VLRNLRIVYFREGTDTKVSDYSGIQFSLKLKVNTEFINMKKLIRKGVFETNSSSAHSIAIATEDKEFVLDTIYPDQHGTIIVRGDEYGWEWFKHNDAETKASYAAQQFANDKDALDKLEWVIKDQTGADRVIFERLDDGYVDHDSMGIVPRNTSELKNFIFNKNSWLFGGNDNSTPDPTFYHVPEIRDGKMIIPTYKYELSIEGLNKTTKFIDYPTQEEINDGLSALLEDTQLYGNGTFRTDDSSNIMWQITRERNLYERQWGSENYDTNEISFMLESFSSYDFQNKLKEKGLIVDGMSWDEKNKILFEEMKKLDDVIITKKFTIKEI